MRLDSLLSNGVLSFMKYFWALPKSFSIYLESYNVLPLETTKKVSDKQANMQANQIIYIDAVVKLSSSPLESNQSHSNEPLQMLLLQN